MSGPFPDKGIDVNIVKGGGGGMSNDYSNDYENYETSPGWTD